MGFFYLCRRVSINTLQDPQWQRRPGQPGSPRPRLGKCTALWDQEQNEVYMDTIILIQNKESVSNRSAECFTGQRMKSAGWISSTSVRKHLHPNWKSSEDTISLNNSCSRKLSKSYQGSGLKQKVVQSLLVTLQHVLCVCTIHFNLRSWYAANNRVLIKCKLYFYFHYMLSCFNKQFLLCCSNDWLTLWKRQTILHEWVWPSNHLHQAVSEHHEFPVK